MERRRQRARRMSARTREKYTCLCVLRVPNPCTMDHQTAAALQPLTRRSRRCGHEVVERPVPLVASETRRRGDRAMDEVEPLGYSLLERAAERETGGDRGRERASGPVGRPGFNPLMGEPAH